MCGNAGHEFTQAPTDFRAVIPCQKMIFPLFLLLLIEEHVLLNRIQGNLEKETPK